MNKKALSILLMLCALLSLISTAVLAVEPAKVEEEPLDDNIFFADGDSDNPTVLSDSTITYPVTGGNLYFDKATGTITDCDIMVTEVEIPERIEGVAVTDIEEFAFSYCTLLTNVTIPDSVVSIGDSAFIGCSSLTNVTIPDNITIIGLAPFSRCDNLLNIDVSTGNLYYCSVNGVLFDRDMSTLIQFPVGKAAGKYTIPDGVASIGPGAFIACSSLTNVTIPDSVTSIGDLAFLECGSLTNVTIPDSVTSIGLAPFSRCDNLLNIDVSTGNLYYCSVDGVLFDRDISTLIQFPAGKAANKYTIPDGIASIGFGAFAGCDDLLGVTIPNSVTSIEESAFSECDNLTRVNFQGDAPRVYSAEDYLSSSFSPDITLYYIPGKAGWTTPLWNGYKTLPNQVWAGDPYFENPQINLEKGESFRLQVEGIPSGSTIIWSNSNPEAVSLGENGEITAREFGMATVRASVTAEGVTKTADCVVTVPGVVFEQQQIWLNKGANFTPIYTAYPNGAQIIWTSSNTNIASVGRNTGEVTAVGSGTTKICGAVTVAGSNGMTITELCTYDVSIYDAYLEQTELTLEGVGGKAYLSLCVNSLPTGFGVETQSSDARVVSVDGMEITAVKIGTAEITVNVMLGEVKIGSYICRVTVPGLSLNKSSLILYKNKSETLKATVVPTGTTVTWSSSDTNVVTVDSSGKVTAIKTGEASITAKINVNGLTYEASCTVTVQVSPEDMAHTFVNRAADFIGKTNSEVKKELKGLIDGAWCASFVGNVAKNVGLNEIIPNYGYVPTLYSELVEAGAEEVTTPETGDIIFWGTSHVGIVYSYDAKTKTVYVIDGNWHYSKVKNTPEWKYTCVCGPKSISTKNKKCLYCSNRTVNLKVDNEYVMRYLRPDYESATIKVNEGQIKLKFKCPIEVEIFYNGEALNSATNSLAASFGTMTCEGNEISAVVEYGNPYSITITGTGTGTMDLEISYETTENANVRSFRNVPITASTEIQVNTNAPGMSTELVVMDKNTDDTVLWYAAPGETVSEADAEATEQYKHQDEIEETVDMDTLSSGGSAGSTYGIHAGQTANGTLQIRPARAGKGDTVTITTIPAKDYELDQLIATDGNGNEIKLTDKGNGTFTFTMPASQVEVTATFRNVAEPLPFTDIPAGAWYEEAARYVYEHGLMTGTFAATFSPDVTTTRGMIVTILWRMAGSPAMFETAIFPDVVKDSYYADAVAWASANGIVNGYDNGLFGPDNPITREQMAAILYRYAQYSGCDMTGRADLSGYTDAVQITGYAVEALTWANANGLITGTSTTTLTPGGVATRAQVATIFMRFMQNVVN